VPETGWLRTEPELTTGRAGAAGTGPENRDSQTALDSGPDREKPGGGGANRRTAEKQSGTKPSTHLGRPERIGV